MKNVIFVLTSVIAFTLVGCGGGASGASESTTVENTQSVNVSGYPAIPQIPNDN